MRRCLAVAVTFKRTVDLLLRKLELLLGLFNHLHGLLPFLLKPKLRLFNFPFLERDPLFNLFLLLLVCSGRQQVLVKLAINQLHFRVLSELEAFFTALYQFLKFVVSQE